MELLAAVRGSFPEDRYFVTAALPAAKSVLALINVRPAAKYLALITRGT